MPQLKNVKISISKSFLFRTFCPYCKTGPTKFYSYNKFSATKIKQMYQLSENILNQSFLLGSKDLVEELISKFKISAVPLVSYQVNFNKLSKCEKEIGEIYLYCDCNKCCWHANFNKQNILNKNRKSLKTKPLKRT